jgi:CheY-like chemotaxis protein
VTVKTLQEMGRSSLAMLVARQVEAMDAWNAARAKREAMYTAQTGASREARLDWARRLDALHRAHDAMLARTADFLACQGDLILTPLPRRAVVAHRQEWFVRQVTEGLREHGITVLAATENGADALGMVVAEQPDLLLVEDKLAMLSGAELVAEAALFAPHTIVAVQVPDSDGVCRMLDAGARNAFARQVPPADIADTLAQMLRTSAA